MNYSFTIERQQWNTGFSVSYVGNTGRDLIYSPNTMFYLHKLNLAPRVGAAYRPWGNNTVFRAGFGVYYAEYPAATASGVGVPYLINEPSYTNPAANPDVILPRVFPVTATVPTSVSLPSSPNPNYGPTPRRTAPEGLRRCGG
jgi:hypothetical protein